MTETKKRRIESAHSKKNSEDNDSEKTIRMKSK